MSRKSLAITIATAVAALAVVFVETGIAAAVDPPVSPPPVPRQNQAQVQAASQIPRSNTTSFVAITPCRIADTRNGTGTNGKKFSANTKRDLTVAGTTGFEQQGGTAGGCGVPVTARAVEFHAVVISPSRKGSLKVWATGLTEPSESFLNYGAFTMSGSELVALPSGAQSGITVKNFTSSTHLRIVVTGYYMPQMHGMVGPGGLIFSGSPSLLSATNPSTGVYVVTFDRDITYCSPMVDTYNAGAGIYGAAYAFSGNTATVFTWYLNSTTHVETLNSFYFYIDVVC